MFEQRQRRYHQCRERKADRNKKYRIDTSCLPLSHESRTPDERAQQQERISA
jgi:hypothetical protein